MTETLTIDLPEAVVREIEQAARAAGQTPEAFVAEAAAQHARALSSARQFFSDRAQDGNLEALDRFLDPDRPGEPPRPGDEID